MRWWWRFKRLVQRKTSTFAKATVDNGVNAAYHINLHYLSTQCSYRSTDISRCPSTQCSFRSTNISRWLSTKWSKPHHQYFPLPEHAVLLSKHKYFPVAEHEVVEATTNISRYPSTQCSFRSTNISRWLSTKWSKPPPKKKSRLMQPGFSLKVFF